MWLSELCLDDGVLGKGIDIRHCMSFAREYSYEDKQAYMQKAFMVNNTAYKLSTLTVPCSFGAHDIV